MINFPADAVHLFTSWLFIYLFSWAIKVSCPHTGKRNSSEVPLSSTWLNCLYFSITSVSPVTAALLHHKSHLEPCMEFCPTPIFHPANPTDLLSSKLPASSIDQTFQPAVDHRDSFFTPWTHSIPHKWPLITPVLLTHTSESVTVSEARGNPENPCVTASIWLHPNSVSVSFSEVQNSTYSPSFF